MLEHETCIKVSLRITNLNILLIVFHYPDYIFNVTTETCIRDFTSNFKPQHPGHSVS